MPFALPVRFVDKLYESGVMVCWPRLVPSRVDWICISEFSSKVNTDVVAFGPEPDGKDGAE